MNILFLLGVYPNYGGTEKVTTILANEFSRQGHSISIVSFEQPFPELAERELDSSIRLHSLSYPVYSADNRRRLRDIVREEHTDIIINQWCLPYYVTQLINYARKGTRCKLVAVHHNLPNNNARIQDVEIAIAKRKGNILVNRVKLFAVRSITRISLRYSYEHSDRYVVLSPGYIPIARRFIGKRKAEKMLALANPLTLPMPETIQEKRKEIIWVGRIEDNQKRTFRLAELWAELEEQYPDWNFSIVGDGPDKDNLQATIDRLHLKRMKLEGFQDPIPFYKRASILILTSEYEGFSLVIVEGMSYGVVPVVYGSYAAVYDIITDGVDGYITPMPYSREVTVSRLRAIMDDPDRARSMAEAARDKSRQFSLPAILAQWEQLFQSLQ